MSFGTAAAEATATDQRKSGRNANGAPWWRAVSNIPAGASEDVSGD